jgi:DNA-binding NarL/FixJ family response regulator
VTMASTDVLRVVIVEDHLMVAEGLALGLGALPDVEVVGIASTLAEAREEIERHRPDVLLVDFRLPDGDGVALVGELQGEGDPAVVMVTSYAEPSVARAALEAGCRGFVLKHAGFEDVVRALDAIRHGSIYVSGALLEDLLPGRRSAPAPDLTARETQMLELLAVGASTTDIAEHLFLSVNTVRNHVQNMLTKLGAQSRLEAVAIGARLGLVRRT